MSKKNIRFEKKILVEEIDPVDTRKLIFEALDPTGVAIDSIEFDYYECGYEKEFTPESYPKGEEPMKQVRYKLTIGDYKYLVNRDGKIIDFVVPRHIKLER